MPGNMTKLEALDWLVKYGAVTRGYPEEPAAAYLVGEGLRGPITALGSRAQTPCRT